MLNNILLRLFIFIGIPTILAVSFYYIGVGLLVHGFIIFICMLFMEPASAFVIGTFIYWLIFLFMTCFFLFVMGSKETQQEQVPPAP